MSAGGQDCSLGFVAQVLGKACGQGHTGELFHVSFLAFLVKLMCSSFPTRSAYSYTYTCTWICDEMCQIKKKEGACQSEIISEKSIENKYRD